MPKPFTEWTVLPHGKLTALEDDLLCVTGELAMPLLDSNRRMTVARLSDGRLVVFSAIALDESEMRALEGFGTLAFLVVPSDIHRMDAKIWKDRYPAMQVIAPPGARAKVEKVVPVDATSVDFGDPRVRFFTVAGMREREGAMLVESSRGTTLVLNDIIFNLANRPGFGGWLMKAIGVTADAPHVASVVKFGVKDERVLADQLEAFSRMPHLNRVIISHGDIITRDPSAVLQRIAHELAA